MVIGLALFSWDQKEGSVLDAKYPEEFNLTSELINQIYMTHSYDRDFTKEELIETNYNEQIILSYCDKRKVSDKGYEILVLITQEKERYRSYKLKAQITEFANELFKFEGVERNNYFLKNLDVFFITSNQKKILILGRAGTGKSTLKKIIFEGANPKDLLYNPLEPTRGITPSIHTWLDLNLGVFDSSGQELANLLTDEEELSMAFDNSNIIIYVIDFPRWSSCSAEIMEELFKIREIAERKTEKSSLIVFFHKVDLISQELREAQTNEIELKIHERVNVPIYFTSIYPNLIYNTYFAFYEMLSNFSEENFALKMILDESLEEKPKIMCFLTNRNNSIIAQTMSKDFDTHLINYSHKLIAQLNLTFEDMAINDNIEHLILTSSKDLNIVMVSLLFLNSKLKNLIIISETVPSNKLILLIRDIKNQLKQFYK
ncbi:MAG: ADP-ribosylation factor-like protein [Promethearchaeota archaeon]